MTLEATAIEHAPAGGTPVRESSRFDRLSFGSGAVAAVLYLTGAVLFIAFVVPQMPAINAPAPERAAFYAAMSRSAVYRSISYLGELQLGFLLLFVGGLFTVLRRAEGGSGALSFAVFGAGITLAVFAPFAIMIEDHLMLGSAAAGVDSATVAAIDGLGPLSIALGGFPQALVLTGTAVLLPRQGIIPRWIGWFGLATAVLSLAGTGTLVWGAMFPISHLASLLFRVWLLALSLVLLRRVGRAP